MKNIDALKSTGTQVHGAVVALREAFQAHRKALKSLGVEAEYPLPLSALTAITYAWYINEIVLEIDATSLLDRDEEIDQLNSPNLLRYWLGCAMEDALGIPIAHKFRGGDPVNFSPGEERLDRAVRDELGDNLQIGGVVNYGGREFVVVVVHNDGPNHPSAEVVWLAESHFIDPTL